MKKQARAFMLLGILAGLGGNGTLPVGPAMAQDTAIQSFSIPSQPLSSALLALAEQTELEILFDARVAEDHTSPPLQGGFTPEQALRRLLAGSGLTYSFTDDKTVTIARAADGFDTPVLSPITVEGQAVSAYGPVQGYKASRSATATKTDSRILDIPASVQVVPREVIEDQDANRLIDALENVSSVHSAGTQGNRNEIFQIRGFQQSRLAKDGFLSASSFTEAGFLDLANVERVEVLKGPASVLYGLTSPGGLINLVTKRPRPEVFYTVDGTAGSFDFYRGEIDLNQPLNDDRTLLFRLNAAYQETDSFRDFFTDSDRTLLAPSLRVAISEDTTLDLQFEYYDQAQPFDRGLVAIGEDADVLPRDRFLGERFSRVEADELRFNAVLDHRFNDSWSLRTSLRAADSTQDQAGTDPRGVQPDGRTLDRRGSTLLTTIDNYAVQTNLLGDVETGVLTHELLIGFDANFTRFNSDFREFPVDSIDIFDPVYGAQPGAVNFVSLQERQIDFYGIYLQDVVSFGEHWKLSLGGRYDYADTEAIRDGDLITDAIDKEFSPRAGLVFQPLQDLSLYVSYSESFEPFVFRVTADGRPFEPEFGEQLELGIKRDWLGGRLSSTLAAFELTRQNVQTPDPDNPDFSIQTGEQRSRGVELDVTGEILPGWQVIGSLTYLDHEITKDNRFPVGNRLQNVPEWSGSLWSSYTVQNGPLRDLRFGGGIFAVGRRAGDLDNSFDAAGYNRIDAFVQYPVNERFQLSLNANNLFDKEFIEAPIGRTQVYPGAPRSVFLKARVTF